jgi:hypothetical protein
VNWAWGVDEAGGGTLGVAWRDVPEEGGGECVESVWGKGPGAGGEGVGGVMTERTHSPSRPASQRSGPTSEADAERMAKAR